MHLWAQTAKQQPAETLPQSAPDPAQPGPEGPRQAGCKHSRTISPHATAWVLRDSRGPGRATPLPVTPQDTASSSPSSLGAQLMPAALAGKQFGFTTMSLGDGQGLAQRWVKVAQLRGQPRRQFGQSRHGKNKKRGCGWVRRQRPYLELWQEPFALGVGSFPSFHPPLSCYQKRPHFSNQQLMSQGDGWSENTPSKAELSLPAQV